MEPEIVEAPAPAQVTPPPSAVEQATINDDVTAYRAARLAERTGTPIQPPEQPAPEQAEIKTKPVAPAQRQQEPDPNSATQQRINERIRVATERAVAERDAEIARLRAQIPSTVSTAPPPTAEQTLAKAVTQPNINAPLMTETDFFAQFPDAPYAAFTRYVTNYELSTREAATQRQTQQQQAFESHRTRATTFQGRLQAATAADPDFGKKLSPDVAGLRPAASLRLDETFTTDNAIAEEIIDSDVPAQLMVHLSTHPEDLAKLRAATSARHLSRLIGDLEHPLRPKATPAAKPVKTHTDAPAAPFTLGRQPAVGADPIEAAVVSDDFQAFQQAKFAKLAAKQGRR